MNRKRLEHIKRLINEGVDPIQPPYIDSTAFVNYKHTTIGKDVVIGPNASIGWFGIGCEWDDDGKLLRFPQTGKVNIGDNVFIAAGAVIDSAADDNNLTEIGDRCIICKKVLNLDTTNCPVSTVCYECWLKRRQKELDGIIDIQCTKCNEFFEIIEPLPERYTCPYCGHNFSLDDYNDYDESEILAKLGR